jgi:soluble lytic murein transglycosylase
VFALPPLHVVLDDPRLEVARERALAKDYAPAAKAMSEARDATAPKTGEDACLYAYTLGRLDLLAGADAAAAVELDRAREVAGCALAPYASLRAAEAYVRAGDGATAVARAREVPDEIAARTEAELTLADALALTGDRSGAVPLWRAALGASPTGARWAETATRLSDALLDGKDGPPADHAEEALDLATRVVVEAPKNADRSGASASRTKALALLQAAGKPATAALGPEQLARQAQGWLDEGDATRAVAAADGVLAKRPRPKPTDETGDAIACRAATTRAHAAHGAGGTKPDAWGEAIARCAKLPELLDALWLGAKASASAGRLVEAVERFGKVEQLFPQSRYADDARFQGALAVREMGDEARALAMLSSLPDAYPEGDTRGEALFRVALAELEKNDLAAAKTVLERAVAVDPRDHAWGTAARAAYFRARVAQLEGDVDDAKKRYATIVGEEPLAYYMALAYARLAALDGAAAKSALDAALAGEPKGDFFTHDHPEAKTEAFRLGTALLEVGEIDAARHELVRAGALADGADPELVWAAASLFDQAGAPEVGHSFARARLTDWLAHYPSGRWRFAWQVAFPRAYEPLVEKASSEYAIPSPLTWAIMREESAFRPDARSHSNALGLMQLLLGTAKRVAKGTDLPHDEDALKRPEVSIPLGAKLLGTLRRTYVTNPELAIAAYNGGSGSVRAWLKARGTQDFDLWVEEIPFDETRGYVKRVLRSEVAYAFLYAPDVLGELLAIPTRVTR